MSYDSNNTVFARHYKYLQPLILHFMVFQYNLYPRLSLGHICTTEQWMKIYCPLISIMSSKIALLLYEVKAYIFKLIGHQALRG